jgi:hypothetical protein
MQKDLADNHSNLADLRANLRTRIGEPDVMQTILGRAIDRGEIAAARLTPRIVSLPTDLARHEILMTFERLLDEAIKEIVDGVFLPLVHPTDERPSSREVNSAAIISMPNRILSRSTRSSAIRRSS